MGFLYTFIKRFKPQYSLFIMTCAFMRIWYRFISFVLHLRLRSNILKHKGLVDCQLTL